MADGHQLVERILDKFDEFFTSKFTGKKIELPCFDGVDPSNWILRAQEYFDFHDTYDEQRVRIVAFDVAGEGAEWYQWMRSKRMLSTWADFKEKVMFRFGTHQLENNFEEEISPKEHEIDSRHESESLVKEPLVLSCVLELEEQVDELSLAHEPKDETLKLKCQIEEISIVNFLIEDIFVPRHEIFAKAISCGTRKVTKVTATYSNEGQKEVALPKKMPLFFLLQLDEIQDLARGVLDKWKMMILNLYSLEEVYWDFIFELYQLHLEDKVVLKGDGMIRAYPMDISLFCLVII